MLIVACHLPAVLVHFVPLIGRFWSYYDGIIAAIQFWRGRPAGTDFRPYPADHPHLNLRAPLSSPLPLNCVSLTFGRPEM
jgi:hypothetical protein